MNFMFLIFTYEFPGKDAPYGKYNDVTSSTDSAANDSTGNRTLQIKISIQN